MRRLLLPLLLAAVAAAPAAGAGPGPRFLPDCLGKPQVRPKSVVFACADANFLAVRLRWSGWGTRVATAHGTARLNDCTPTCVAGHFHAYRAVLQASGRQRCGRVLAYARVSYRLLGGTLPGRFPRRGVYPFRCR